MALGGCLLGWHPEFDIDTDTDSLSDTDTDTERLPLAADYLHSQGGEMIAFAAGTFIMGCTEGQTGCHDDETAHEVTITRDYWIGETEVTRDQWEALMGPWSFTYPNASGSYPVNEISWYDVLAYANALSASEGFTPVYVINGADTTQNLNADGYRLPTEAEWEYAARCGEDLLYAGSDELDSVGWYVANAGGASRPVAGKSPNACGLHDMSGNVWEWVWDRMDFGYSGEPEIDPTGPAAGTNRVLRGGNWNYGASLCRVANRYAVGPVDSDEISGFRLARTVPSPPE